MAEPLTVAQLIEQLTAMSPDAFVVLEGCDCVSACAGVEADAELCDGVPKGAATVTILRVEPPYWRRANPTP